LRTKTACFRAGGFEALEKRPARVTFLAGLDEFVGGELAVKGLDPRLTAGRRRFAIEFLLRPEDAAPVLMFGNRHAALDAHPDALAGLGFP